MNKLEKPLTRLQFVLENIAPAFTTKPEQLIDYVLNRVKALDVKIQRDSPKLVNQVTDVKLSITPSGVCCEYEVGKSGCKGMLNVSIPGRPKLSDMTPKQIANLQGFIANMPDYGMQVYTPRHCGKNSGMQAFAYIQLMVERGLEINLKDRIIINFLEQIDGVVDVDFDVTPARTDDYKKVYIPNSNGGYPCL